MSKRHHIQRSRPGSTTHMEFWWLVHLSLAISQLAVDSSWRSSCPHDFPFWRRRGFSPSLDAHQHIRPSNALVLSLSSRYHSQQVPHRIWSSALAANRRFPVTNVTPAKRGGWQIFSEPSRQERLDPSDFPTLHTVSPTWTLASFPAPNHFMVPFCTWY